MEEYLQFQTRNDFRDWLQANHTSTEGIWLLFSKSKNIITLKASEALEEALCFGWIDGVMKRIDNQSYIKYFALRRKNSKWSDKNKGIVADLEKRGLMTDAGRAKIAEAKQNGQWEKGGKLAVVADEQLEMLTEILKAYDQAYTNFLTMSPSVKKTYVRAYMDAKTDAGREKRLAWMVDRLERNLKPM